MENSIDKPNDVSGASVQSIVRRSAYRKKRIATAIAADIMRGYFGQASELQIIVNGKKDSVWEFEPLVQRIITVLDDMDA